MTNTDLKRNLEKLLALRAELLGDMTKMEDDSLKDHAKTISIPTDKEELGSDNAEQELTLTLLGSDENILTKLKLQSTGSKTATMAGARNAVKKSPSPAWTPSLMPRTACDVLRNGKQPYCLSHLAAYNESAVGVATHLPATLQ